MLDPQQKVLTPSFNLAKKRIYVRTYLKEELTDLFWRLLEYSLFPQAGYKEDGEHFDNG